MAKIYVDTDEYRDEFYQDVLTILSADDTNDRANEIIDVFDNLPAADVAPIVHSSWEEIEMETVTHHSFLKYRFRCMHCGGNTPLGAYVIAPDYCPNCGAKMDGKEET